MKQLTDLVPAALEVLGLTPTQIVIEATSRTKTIVTAEEFITSCLLCNSAAERQRYLKVGARALQKANKVCSLGTATKSKRIVILEMLQLKQCPKCSTVDNMSMFGTTTTVCRACDSKSSREYHKNNKESIAVTKTKYRKDNKEVIAAKARVYNEAHKEEITKRNKIYYAEHKEEFAVANKLYRESPEGKVSKRASSAKRRASKINRTPSWSELVEIKAFYGNCPKGYHVDHVIPLQGKQVSGLHVIGNLQYLSAEDNLSKSNKFDPDQHSRDFDKFGNKRLNNA